LARFSAQWREEPWRSASTSTVRFPSSAKRAARLVDNVVLPTPPFELATSTVFIPTPGYAGSRRVHGHVGGARAGAC
jgi:hypothetical protein